MESLQLVKKKYFGGLCALVNAAFLYSCDKLLSTDRKKVRKFPSPRIYAPTKHTKNTCMLPMKTGPINEPMDIMWFYLTVS